MKLTRAFAAAFSLTFAFASFAAAQSTPKPTPSPSASPTPLKLERTTKFDGEVAFPDVDGWEKSDKYKYPTPALGYSVNYESPEAGRVTVYVYNAGHAKIPNDLTGLVAAEMAKAKTELQAAVDAGLYESAKAGTTQTVMVGGTKGAVRSLHTPLAVRARGNDLDSDIYIFPYNDHFIKIRATRRKSAEGKHPDLVALFEQIDALFAR